MLALISPIHHIFRPSAPAKLQASQQTADAAIQRLRESGDPQVASVLIARYEELKKRYDRLRELQGLRKVKGPSIITPEESKEDDKAETSSQRISIDQLEDGSFKFTLPPDEPGGERKVFILTSPDFNEKDPVHNMIITAEELIKTGNSYVSSQKQNLQESQKTYLATLRESLKLHKEKIDSLEKAEPKSVVFEVLAQLYLNEAFRYLQTAQLVKNVIEGAFDEEPNSDSDERKPSCPSSYLESVCG